MTVRRPGRGLVPAIALCALVSVLTVGVPSPPAPAADPPYRPPVDRPVSRPFDLTRGPYGAGNRGLDYAVRPGDRVVAIGAGTVVFAGTVAGERFVTVAHPDGLRSSYSYLDRVLVRMGEAVAGGQPVGTTGTRFQLGIRRGRTYLDPAPLLGGRTRPRHARLVR